MVFVKNLFNHSFYCSVLLLSVLESVAYAHSGNVDQDGGHYCTTGACEGTYHYHNGVGSGLIVTIIFLLVVYFLIWKGTERKASRVEPVSVNTSSRTAGTVKHDMHIVTSVAESLSEKQSRLPRSYDEIEQLIEQARRLQDHENWYDRSESYNIWILGYVLTWLAKDASEAFKAALISEDQNLKKTTYDIMRPEIQRFVLKTFTSVNSQPFMQLLDKSIIFDENFVDGLLTARKDKAHFMKTGEMMNTISHALEFERSSSDENEHMTSLDWSRKVADGQVVDRYFEEVADWLTSVTNIEEIEAKYSVKDDPSWNELLTLYVDEDELWNFCTPSSYWEILRGRSGFALVRQKRVIYVIEIIKN